MVKRSLLLCAALAAALASSIPASAANVSVTLRLSAAEPVVTQAELSRCSVSVPEGADGEAVLAQATEDGCIESYETTSFSGGSFLDCINGICSTDATYWRMTENGALTSYGIDGFEATAGDVLGFSYTTWVGCLADPALC